VGRAGRQPDRGDGAAAAAAAAYNATIYVRNSTTNCESAGSAFTVTVSAINNPSGQSATRDAVNVTSEIDLAWTRNAQTHDVMVVRKTSASLTEPTQGTATASATASATAWWSTRARWSLQQHGPVVRTTYDYKFYSVNGNYYSAGVRRRPPRWRCRP
jgi:hypothetical protein